MPRPGFSGADNGLGTMRNLELGEDVGDVVAHGLGVDVEPSGDLLVIASPDYEVEDPALAGGELK